MRTIEKSTLQDMLRRHDVALVEVLDPDMFRKFHLPNAINVPLDKNFDDRIQQVVPDKRRPVVVYCSDRDCEASPAAAKRMDELGYEHVFDYAAGKLDWKNAGLPIAGGGHEARPQREA